MKEMGENFIFTADATWFVNAIDNSYLDGGIDDRKIVETFSAVGIMGGKVQKK